MPGCKQEFRKEKIMVPTDAEITFWTVALIVTVVIFAGLMIAAWKYGD